MTGWIVAAVGAAVAVWSVMRVRGLHREIADVRLQLARHREQGSQEPLALVVRDDELEHLVAELDTSLDALRSNGIATAAREIRLRREIADISHDLKTPLIAVRGYLQLVQRDGASADTSPRRLQTVLERVDDLGRLVDDFFELSVLDAGVRELELGPVDATEVVTEALLGFYVAFEAKGIEPTVLVPAEPLVVRAEATALGRVVRNLVANALAHGGGDVEVSLSREDDQAVLRVTNDAPGLAPADAERLFERFYRADPARTGAHAGLGLSIVQELVRQMGGRVQARAEQDRLRITVELPLAAV
ncbi:HAMP domain-containing sensor histidine kinase [Luteococcus sp. H138]|uniref:sensor histidine kinase n=1 Tax=unclassified Luteococcus TaxID=2639923 RepID=UPI00313CC1D5